MTQNLKKAICWIVADVRVLPNAPNWTPDADKAIVQIVKCGNSSRADSEEQLREELWPLGYELLCMEERAPFDDIAWPTHRALIDAKSLFWKFVENEKMASLQFGTFSFYDEDEAEQDA